MIFVGDTYPDALRHRDPTTSGVHGAADLYRPDSGDQPVPCVVMGHGAPASNGRAAQETQRFGADVPGVRYVAGQAAVSVFPGQREHRVGPHISRGARHIEPPDILAADAGR